ncbi:F-box/LRR-repeat protein 12 [Ambystoma mexicanum]|uniref:F-box/LRR-repeat protein 12 n=1 Tax=Ambystoma mexicanum TaxID=8296 RepID=UPI0037E8E751
MAATVIGYLPDSILVEVFSFLSVRDLLRSSRVCKHWKRLVLDKALWRNVDLSPHKINSKVLWHLVRRYLGGSLKALKVKGLLHSAKKLEFLSQALLQELGKRSPNLLKLCLSETDLRRLRFDSLPSSVKTLELSHCEIPSLWFQGDGTKGNCKLYPKVEHLVLSHVPGFSNLHLETLCRETSLKTLSLTGTYRVTDVGIEKAAEHLKGLQHLRLQGCNITDGALHVIGRHLKALQKLELVNFRSLTDFGLSCLDSLKDLSSLGLEWCMGLSPGSIISVCTVMPKLLSLNLNGIVFEDQGIHQILQSLPGCAVTNKMLDLD